MRELYMENIGSGSQALTRIRAINDHVIMRLQCICPMPFCMKITIFFPSPVFSTSESGNNSSEDIWYLEPILKIFLAPLWCPIAIIKDCSMDIDIYGRDCVQRSYSGHYSGSWTWRSLVQSRSSWCQYSMRLDPMHRAYSSLLIHPFGLVHWVPEQLNIKTVNGACKLIDGCSLKAVFSLQLSKWHYLAYAKETKVNSTTWLYGR